MLGLEAVGGWMSFVTARSMESPPCICSLVSRSIQQQTQYQALYSKPHQSTKTYSHLHSQLANHLDSQQYSAHLYQNSPKDSPATTDSLHSLYRLERPPYYAATDCSLSHLRSLWSSCTTATAQRSSLSLCSRLACFRVIGDPSQQGCSRRLAGLWASWTTPSYSLSWLLASNSR